jgi:hypothetical protein
MSIKVPLTNSQNRTQTPTPYIVRLAHQSHVQHPRTAFWPHSALAAASAGSTLHALSCADRNCWLGVGGCGSHALLDLAGHGQESLLDVGGALCGRLEEGNAEAVCELLLYVLVVAPSHQSPECAPLLPCTRQPSCPPYRTCYPPVACSRPRWRIGRSPAAIASRC